MVSSRSCVELREELGLGFAGGNPRRWNSGLGTTEPLKKEADRPGLRGQKDEMTNSGSEGSGFQAEGRA